MTRKKLNAEYESVDTERMAIEGRPDRWPAATNVETIDDFEANDLSVTAGGDWGSWSVESGGGASTDNSPQPVPYRGDYSGSVAITDGSNTQIDIVANRSSHFKPRVISGAIMLNKESDYGSSFSFQDGASTEPIIDVQLLDPAHPNSVGGTRTLAIGYSATDGSTTQYNSGWGWEPNNWYLVEATLDWDALTGEVFINDRFFREITLESGISGINEVEIETANAGSGTARRFYADAIQAIV